MIHTFLPFWAVGPSFGGRRWCRRRSGSASVPTTGSPEDFAVVVDTAVRFHSPFGIRLRVGVLRAAGDAERGYGEGTDEDGGIGDSWNPPGPLG